MISRDENMKAERKIYHMCKMHKNKVRKLEETTHNADCEKNPKKSEKKA